MRKLNLTIIVWLSALMGGLALAAEKTPPYLYVLGVGQDAGYPQSGCYQPHCMRGWQDPALRRGATSVALIDPQANKKYLFEATPNFPEQLYQLEVEAPDAQFSFAGIFLTHAHIGHYAGLMFLGHEAMGASGVNVYAMPRMAEYLQSNGPWSQLVNYKNIVIAPLQDAVPVELGQVTVEPFLVPHRDEFSETVGYRITGPDKSALFIPDINKWSVWDTDLAAILATVDYALLDATFYADDELPGRDMSNIPHPFVSETMQRLQELPASERNKVWFIHINHTNPLLDTDSEESQQVRANGFNIAVDGLRLDL
jgi:pyrroloquinoline quinone biosynthesis protein B